MKKREKTYDEILEKEREVNYFQAKLENNDIPPCNEIIFIKILFSDDMYKIYTNTSKIVNIFIQKITKSIDFFREDIEYFICADVMCECVSSVETKLLSQRDNIWIVEVINLTFHDDPKYHLH